MLTKSKLPETRTYDRRNCITFRKTAEEFGGLSNMAGGYPLSVNGVNILTSEALYQACRFPHLPDVQRMIISERSPMTAKMKSKTYRDNSRPDWDIVRTKIMSWCLQVKLIQNWDKFSQLLLKTGDLPIVEDSTKDDFWGAKPENETVLFGVNVLGRLLMHLRQQVRNGEITIQTIIRPLPIKDFLLYGQEIKLVTGNIENQFFSHINSSTTNQILIPYDKPLIVSNKYINNLNHCLEDKPNEILKENISSSTDLNQFDSFLIMLPYLEKALETECTLKDIAKLFNVPQKLMSKWLEKAIKIGKVQKLSKPTRYTIEPQLTLFMKTNYR